MPTFPRGPAGGASSCRLRLLSDVAWSWDAQAPNRVMHAPRPPAAPAADQTMLSELEAIGIKSDALFACATHGVRRHVARRSRPLGTRLERTQVAWDEAKRTGRETPESTVLGPSPTTELAIVRNVARWWWRNEPPPNREGLCRPRTARIRPSLPSVSGQQLQTSQPVHAEDHIGDTALPLQLRPLTPRTPSKRRPKSLMSERVWDRTAHVRDRLR